MYVDFSHFAGALFHRPGDAFKLFRFFQNTSDIGRIREPFIEITFRWEFGIIENGFNHTYLSITRDRFAT